MDKKRNVPEIRFAGFTDDWEQRKLGEVLSPYLDPVGTPNNGYIRLGLRSHTKGTFHSIVEAGRELEVAQMHRVAKDKFILNITFAWEHAVAVTDENDEGKLVSHRFPQFSFDDKLIPSFFKYLILDKKFREYLELCSPGGAGRNRVLKIKEMLKYEIKIPKSKKEQTAIGNFFKQLDETIALHQREYEKYKNLKISYLEKMFPKENKQFPELRFPEFTDVWEQRKLGEIGANFYGGGTPNTAIDNFWNGHLAWLQSSDISEFDVLHSNPKKFITLKGLQNSAAKKIPSKSIAIVTRVGVGKVLLVPFEYSTSQDFLSISELKIDELFAIYAISKLMNIEKDNVQGTSIKGITKNELLDKSIFIPKDKTEQTAIGNFFKQLDETIALHQRELEKYKQIKQSYLEKMFI